MTTAGTGARRLRLGTRGSRLALTQSEQVADALRRAAAEGARTGSADGFDEASGLDIELVTVRTDGDGDRTSLHRLGGVGVFAARLRRALLDGEVDLVVHSFKDLPTQPVGGLEVVCVPPREDPRDALCARDGLTLATLPEGARVGTGSPRRAAQLLAARPDLEVVDLRGNVPTRLARVRGQEAVGVGADEPVAPSRADAVGDLDAVVLALSGLRRLGLERCASEVLDFETMLPAPAQGALAVEARAGELEAQDAQGRGVDSAGSAALARAMAALDDEPTRLAVTAERALMAGLGAGCAAPVGAWARLRGGERELGVLVLRAVVTSLDGGREVGCELSTELPEAAGGPDTPGDSAAAVRAAQALGVRVAEVLLEDGAADIVDLHADKPRRD